VEARLLEVPDRAYLRERHGVDALCDELSPDVLHTHGYRPDVVDSGVARRRGIPTVSTVHGFIGGTFRGRIYERLQRRAFRRFGAVVAVSKQQVGVLEEAGVPPERIHVVPNAVDGVAPLSRGEARSRWGIDEDAFHIGWVGRLSLEKGPDVLLDALRLIDLDGVVSSFVGDGPLMSSLRERARAAGLDDHVRWHGLVPDAAILFPAFDVLVLSSRTEGSPMVLLEAMSMGIPVVAARVGGIPDMVGSLEAVLVPRDDPEALARALSHVRSDRSSAGTRADAARTRFDEDFGFDAWVHRYETIYRTLADTGKDG
jgi:glycosyltransferase involved in cell wall biosynthesis